MVNGLRGNGSRRPSSIAIVGVSEGYGTRLAAELVTVAAAHRYGAVLVNADMRRGADVGPGLADILDGIVGVDDALVEGPSGFQVLRAGYLDGRDPYQVADPDRLKEVVAELAARTGLVVFDAASLQTAPESQTLCAAVDCVILVVRRGVTRRQQLRVAQELLAAVDAPLAGVVIDVAPSQPEHTVEPELKPSPAVNVASDRRLDSAVSDSAVSDSAVSGSAASDSADLKAVNVEPADLEHLDDVDQADSEVATDSPDHDAIPDQADPTITADTDAAEERGEDASPVVLEKPLPAKVLTPSEPVEERRNGAS